MIPGSPKRNISMATAEKPPAKMPAGSIRRLPSANPPTEAPPSSSGPRKTAASAIPRPAERPCLVSSSQCRALSSSARRISAVVDTSRSLALHELIDDVLALGAPRQLEEELLEAPRAAAGSGAELLQRPHRDDAAAVHDRHPVAEGLGDLQDMG